VRVILVLLLLVVPSESKVNPLFHIESHGSDKRIRIRKKEEEEEDE